MIVTLPRAADQVLRAHCESQYPNEACGAILGSDERVIHSVMPAANVHVGDQGRRYLVSPEFQLAAEHQARALGLDVIGFYHSHPDHPAVPSETDRRQAWPGYLYLICAVESGRATRLGAFALDDRSQQFFELTIQTD